MAQKNTKEQEPKNISVDIILSDSFVLTELSGVVDVLRLANRVIGNEMFTYRYVSKKACMITSSAQTFLRAEALEEKPNADIAVFLGNSDLSFTSRSIEQAVHKYRFLGSKVILLAEAAAMYISSNQNKKNIHTTHWENRLLLEERKGIYDIKSYLAVSDDKVITCAGLVSTYDVMLQVMANFVSDAKLMTMSSILLMDRVRSFETMQPGALDNLNSKNDPTIDKAIKIMQANLEEPLSIKDLAGELAQTPRSLERQFQKHLKRSPGNFYRELRLIRAHYFLINTNMKLSEVAAACGFGNNFGKAYKSYYAKTPRQTRKEKNL